jgi:hypothetical protein
MVTPHWGNHAFISGCKLKPLTGPRSERFAVLQSAGQSNKKQTG